MLLSHRSPHRDAQESWTTITAAWIQRGFPAPNLRSNYPLKTEGVLVRCRGSLGSEVVDSSEYLAFHLVLSSA